VVQAPKHEARSVLGSSAAFAAILLLLSLVSSASASELALGEPVVSSVSTFTSQSAGSGFRLPDGRAWELVSPADKDGAGILSTSFSGGLVQAAEDGGGVVYLADGPIVGEPEGNPAPVSTQVLSSRGVGGGWSSRGIATPHEGTVGSLFGGYGEYKLFSSDLTVGLVEPHGETALAPLEAGAEQTIYLRDSETGGYLPLVTKGNVPEGKHFGGTVKFDGASPDLSHVVFSSPEALTPGAFREGESSALNLYEWSAGRPAGGELQLVSVLPNHNAASEEGKSAFLGGFGGNLIRQAVSSDGTRVVWEAERNHLYVRDMARGETVQLDEVRGGEGTGGGSEGVRFQAASRDGSSIFFTDTERLVAGSSAESEKPDLYVFEAPVGAPLSSGTLRDLTIVQAGANAEVLGVLPGVSEDGSYAYFVANGVLAPGAVTGTTCEQPGGVCNLYVMHRGATGWEAPKLVSTLSYEDRPDWSGEGVASARIGMLTSRVSPNGRYLAFMSDRSLTGYDNDDRDNGIADEEVYVYDAGSGSGSGSRPPTLACASCNPGGVQPVGVEASNQQLGTSRLFDHLRIWSERWVAGDIPGWTPVSEFDENTLYQSRYLSDSGRLFFDSSDKLVPGDESGQVDVYEYEPEGIGSCSGASAYSRSVVFKPASSFEVEGVKGEEDAGCVGLISSGTAGEEATFLDASASSGDVFFLTSAPLVGQDLDSAFDLYDAHECTSSSPCPPPETPASLPCVSTGECQGPGAPAGVFAAPASTTLTGAGNLAPQPAAKPVVKPFVRAKSLTRAQKLASALKACKKQRRRSRRASCEKQARSKYGPANVKEKAKAKKSGRASDERGTK
jgi:hypothetical protein